MNDYVFLKSPGGRALFFGSALIFTSACHISLPSPGGDAEQRRAIDAPAQASADGSLPLSGSPVAASSARPDSIEESVEVSSLGEACDIRLPFFRHAPNRVAEEAIDNHRRTDHHGAIERRRLPGTIAHIEPPPPDHFRVQIYRPHLGKTVPIEDLVMPSYDDTMPLFERAGPWQGPRCYLLKDGPALLTQKEAYELYARMVAETLFDEIDPTPEVRTVIGLRGAYPGTFTWHANEPNLFNDTLVLLWIDAAGEHHVREFPVNTETGAYNFGIDASSSLWPNRRYTYVNGWHRSYHALQMDQWSYRVRDDSNKNGHWDDDRNGWLDGGAPDHFRPGNAHNIHMAQKHDPLETATVDQWSAGCQVIPGQLNWTEFITHAWTQIGDEVDYFLIDSRDIAPSVWEPCPQNEGTHACPYRVETFPFEHHGNTQESTENFYDTYNCSDADESGPEKVYVINLKEPATINATIVVEDGATVDPDLYLLTGDERTACETRGHQTISYPASPGRYVLVVDTWVNDAGEALAGPYTLHITLD